MFDDYKCPCYSFQSLSVVDLIIFYEIIIAIIWYRGRLVRGDK